MRAIRKIGLAAGLALGLAGCAAPGVGVGAGAGAAGASSAGYSAAAAAVLGILPGVASDLGLSPILSKAALAACAGQAVANQIGSDAAALGANTNVTTNINSVSTLLGQSCVW